MGEDSGPPHPRRDGVPQLQVRVPEGNAHSPTPCRHSIDAVRRDCLLRSGWRIPQYLLFGVGMYCNNLSRGCTTLTEQNQPSPATNTCAHAHVSVTGGI